MKGEGRSSKGELPGTSEFPTLNGELKAWFDAGRTLDWEGHSIFVREEGRGEPLLLIHGFPTASWDWHAVWPDLCARFRLIAPDLLGFGFSAKPKGPYSILGQADLIESVCRQIGVDKVHILAHDYGDTVAQELLARRLVGAAGLEIRSVCFLNGGLFPDAHRARFIQKLLASRLGPLVVRLLTERRFRRSFSAIFASDRRPSEDQLRDFWTLVNWNRGRDVVPSLLGYLKERKTHARRWVRAVVSAPVPVRFVNGLQDPVSGRHMAERYRQRVANPDLVEIPDSGHYPQLETPAKVVAALTEFIDSA